MRLQRMQDLNILYDEEDEQLLLEYTWNLHPAGYASANNPFAEGPPRVFMHRIIMNAPTALVVDHINGNRLDNRKANLRLGSYADNNRNLRAKPRSVDLPRCISVLPSGRYNVKVYKFQPITLGTYDTLEEAITVRDQWYQENGHCNGSGIPLTHTTEQKP
jgi:hypothetical protein